MFESKGKQSTNLGEKYNDIKTELEFIGYIDEAAIKNGRIIVPVAFESLEANNRTLLEWDVDASALHFKI
ncbi:MAG: hypothetical protein JSW28_01545 [Thermoplasmata archaeon]|nr:MAG: hypothetical protein JSW28_01545 [Thermoplasmata archaeon]